MTEFHVLIVVSEIDSNGQECSYEITANEATAIFPTDRKAARFGMEMHERMGRMASKFGGKSRLAASSPSC
jgi:hypothetical protein